MLNRRVVADRRGLPFHKEEQIDLVDIADQLSKLTASDPLECLLDVDDRHSAVVLYEGPTSALPLRLFLLALRDSDSRPIQFTPGSPLSDMEMSCGFAGDVTDVALWRTVWRHKIGIRMFLGCLGCLNSCGPNWTSVSISRLCTNSICWKT